MSKNFALSASFEYLCYGSMVIVIFLFFQCGGPTLESDIYRCQILMSKVSPRAERGNQSL